MQQYDPTTEPRGFHRVPPKTRHLRRNVQRTYTGSNTIALTDCRVIGADGSSRIFRKNRNNKLTTEPVVPATLVQVNHKRELLGPISTYIEVADRVGLDAATVAKLYRYRRDNGYSIPTDVTIETNATFRGA